MAGSVEHGAVERGVIDDLATVPPALRKGGLAQTALLLARNIDAGEIEPRDRIAASRELRMLLTEILSHSPRKGVKDGVDQIRDDLAARRAARKR
jgi:hypothetical protein